MAKYQNNRASCGPAALHNALAALGLERTEEELIKLSGQNPAGCGVKGILKAIRAISNDEHKLVGQPFRNRSPLDATVGLWYHVSDRGRPVILCVDDLDHWVVCTGHLGPRFQVVDSADNRLVLHYDGAELLKRWAYPRNGDKPAFHGIIV